MKYLVKNNKDIFEDAFEDFFKPVCFNRQEKGMRTDIKENDKEYAFEIEMPGFNKDEIKITLEDNYLTVSAQKAEKQENEDKQTHNYIRRERNVSVSRSYYIDEVQKDKIKAKYENGILSIIAPKEEPKKLEQSTITIE